MCEISFEEILHLAASVWDLTRSIRIYGASAYAPRYYSAGVFIITVFRANDQFILSHTMGGDRDMNWKMDDVDTQWQSRVLPPIFFFDNWQLRDDRT